MGFEREIGGQWNESGVAGRMTLKCDTQETENLIQELVHCWQTQHAIGPTISKLHQHLLHMAGDRADAREMLDQTKLENFQLLEALATEQEYSHNLERKMSTVVIFLESFLEVLKK